MHAFDVITGSGHQMNAGGKGNRRSGIRGPLIGALQGCVAKASSDPIPVIAPGCLLGNQPLIGRSIIGAQEQIGIVVTSNKEYVVTSCRRNKETTKPVRVIICKINA
jgi:hypothetical protein